MRVKITLEYDGTNYYGYQHQPNRANIQDTFEKALETISQKNVKTFASGRTDGHVHAKGQVLHFDTNVIMDEARWMKSLNSLLPSDIKVKEAKFVNDDFHARFSAIKKEYRYYIKLNEYDCFLNNYTAYYKTLDIDKMKEAIKYFIGEHDFKSYSGFVEKKSTIRTIYEAEINKFNDILEIRFLGNGFLKYMVRIMVGTLIEVGLGKKEPIMIKEILEALNRDKSGKTASPNGLYLYKVYYEGE